MENSKEKKWNGKWMLSIFFSICILNIILVNYLDITNAILIAAPSIVYMHIENGTFSEFLYITFSVIFGIQYTLFLVASPFIFFLISKKSDNRIISQSFRLMSIIFILGIILTAIYLSFPYLNEYFNLFIVQMLVFIIPLCFILKINKPKVLNSLKIILIALSIHLLVIIQIHMFVISHQNYVIETTKSLFKEGQDIEILKMTFLGVKKEVKKLTIKESTNNYKNLMAIIQQIDANEMNDIEIINVFEKFYENNNYMKDEFFDNYMKDTISIYTISKGIYIKCKDYDLSIINKYKTEGLEKTIQYISESDKKSLLGFELSRYYEKINSK